MDKNEFLSSFADQFDDTDVATISLDTKFKDLDEWSSMVALMVIAMVDENYGKKIIGADLRESNTIEELFNRVSAK